MKTKYPYLRLTVSKEYTKIYLVSAKDNKKLLGKTLDYTAGEAFDKVAKLLGLGSSGGQIIDRLARKGDESQYDFPRSMYESDDFNFSFIELERAVGRKIEELKKECEPHKKNKKLHKELCKNWIADVAASFQEAVVDILIGKLIKAVEVLEVGTVTMDGSISENTRLRDKLGRACSEMDVNLH
jgi:N6-L-threonylcarbamoyladenine synthase